MWLTIDLNSELPIYAQIRNQVIEGILAENLKGGEPLPSVRQLAADLGVNLHTVNKAYNLLKQEGFIQIHRQKGTVVNPPESYKADREYYIKLNEEARRIIVESFCRGVSKEDFLKVCGEIYDSLNKLTRGMENDG